MVFVLISTAVRLRLSVAPSRVEILVVFVEKVRFSVLNILFSDLLLRMARLYSSSTVVTSSHFSGVNSYSSRLDTQL